MMDLPASAGSHRAGSAGRWQLVGGTGAAALAVVSWWFGWNGYVSALAVVLCNAYLVSVLLEATFRSQQERTVVAGVPQPKPARFMEFPERTWSLLQVQFMLIVVIFGFANLYIKSGDVRYLGPAAIEQTDQQAHVSAPRNAGPAQLVDPIDGLYYSGVTFSTVGYGDFVPTSHRARLLVLWQLVTGMLMVLGVFPLIVGRVSDF
jgi:hypothetical protein